MSPVATAPALVAVVRRRAPERRLDLVGIVPLIGQAPHAEAWRRWLDRRRHGGLDYLERTREERADPRRRNPEARSLLVFGQRYTDGWPAEERADWLATVSRYARGRDYHDVLLRAVKALLGDLRAEWPELRAFPAVDTGPYLERDWAEAAGLGFVGRNTCLIHEALGSGLFLAVAPTNLDVDDWTAVPRPLYQVAERPADPRPGTDRCGSCTRCLDACPTGAIVAAREVDAGRCLSTWTIEWQGRAPSDERADQGARLFGCDVCQEVCPWNARAARQADRRPPPDPAYGPLGAHAELTLADLMVMDAGEFRRRFRRTPLWRQHPEGLRRNALVVAANTGRRDLRPLIARVAEQDPDAEVRSVATWALAELGGES
ncbi:tRNA epoxyqueuosine(34) reductase QueG [bacterium]|nr:tRNA epoxyqueuosine(34) reductase QueG [bacterium]